MDTDRIEEMDKLVRGSSLLVFSGDAFLVLLILFEEVWYFWCLGNSSNDGS
jgi:hypothetical protein